MVPCGKQGKFKNRASPGSDCSLKLKESMGREPSLGNVWRKFTSSRLSDCRRYLYSQNPSSDGRHMNLKKSAVRSGLSQQKPAVS